MEEKKAKEKILAVVGPTAGGKSALAMALAERLGGEIISCDSMQVYRRMDIGTAKPTAEEQKKIRHHMIDIVEPDAGFSCADYVPLAEAAIRDCVARGMVPVVCGGSWRRLHGKRGHLRSMPGLCRWTPKVRRQFTPTTSSG